MTWVAVYDTNGSLYDVYGSAFVCLMIFVLFCFCIFHCWGRVWFGLGLGFVLLFWFFVLFCWGFFGFLIVFAFTETGCSLGLLGYCHHPGNTLSGLCQLCFLLGPTSASCLCLTQFLAWGGTEGSYLKYNCERKLVVWYLALRYQRDPIDWVGYI